MTAAGPGPRFAGGIPASRPRTPYARIRYGRACFRGHGARGLRLLRRRRPLADAPPEYGPDFCPRHYRQGQRPRRRDPRPRLLDHRRHLPASPNRRRRRGGGSDPVQAWDRNARPLQHEHGHAPPARRARRREPADGAVIDYALKTDIPGSVTLEIADAAGRTIRRYSSEDKGEFPTPESAPVPLYWYRKPLKLQTTAGMHRFLWDMRYQPLEGGGGRGGGRGSLPISATPFNTVPTPNSIWAPAGLYTIKLTVGGQTLKQPLALRTDPRVKTTAEGLRRQAESSLAMYDGILAPRRAPEDADPPRADQESPRSGFESPGSGRRHGGAGRVRQEGGRPRRRDRRPRRAGGAFGGQMGPGAAGAQDTLASIGSSLNSLMTMLQASDTAPTSQLAAAVAERKKALEALLGKWDSLRTRELAVLNGLLNAAKLEEIKLDK